MPVSEIPIFKPSSNETILNALRAGLTPQYQARIPNVTKANIQTAVQDLMTTPNLRNELVDALVNRIGLVLFKFKTWTNPMREFKRDPLEWGAVIEEIQVGLLEAKTYDPDRDYTDGEIWRRELPPVEVAYHRINRQDYYKVTVSDKMLRRAFLTGNGLSEMMSGLMQSLYNSDNNDEFAVMCSLFAEYARNGGYFKVNAPNVQADASSEADAKTLLRSIRATAGNLAFFSPHYNAAGLHTFAAPEDLVLFCTPEVKAAIDVNAFAAAFNIPYADVPSRLITIPRGSFGIAGVQAILTTKDFFVVVDTLMENRKIENPMSMNINYFFHHHQIVSLSLFVPAVMFWTGAGDTIPEVEGVVTGISAITAKLSEDGSTVTDPAPLERGQLYIMEALGTTDPAEAFNDGVKWRITGNQSSGTYIHQTGNLQIGGDETATSITVVAQTTWIDPEQVEQDGFTATRTFSLTGELLPLWPRVDVPSDIKVEGVSVSPAFDPAVTSYTVVVPGGTTTVEEVVVIGLAADQYEVTLNGSNDVATVVTFPGGDKTYTITVN